MAGGIELNGNERFVDEIMELFGLSMSLEKILVTFEGGDGFHRLNQGSRDWC